MVDLLKVRKDRKTKKPTFRRQDSHKKVRLQSSGWRYPSGQDSKIRQGRKGYQKKVSTGYRSPVAVRGLSPEGLKPVNVTNVKMLEGLDPKTDGVVVCSSVGLRKKTEIINKCKELKLKIINIKNPDEYLNQKQSQKKAKKPVRKKETKKSAKQETAKSDAETKETSKTADEKDTGEDEKLQEKKEHDKVLSKKS